MLALFNQVLLGLFISSYVPPAVVSYCADYMHDDCNAICRPNNYIVSCTECSQSPPTCLCKCPSYPPTIEYCQKYSSPYCSGFCGNGGTGYLCIGPSGFQECACLCKSRIKSAVTANETFSLDDDGVQLAEEQSSNPFDHYGRLPIAAQGSVDKNSFDPVQNETTFIDTSVGPSFEANSP